MNDSRSSELAKADTLNKPVCKFLLESSDCSGAAGLPSLVPSASAP